MKWNRLSILLVFMAGMLVSNVYAQENPAKNMPDEVKSYLEEVMTLISEKAIHRSELNLDSIRTKLYAEAGRAGSTEEAHAAVKSILPMLNDHHSYFMSSQQLQDQLGFSEEDIEVIKEGTAPKLPEESYDSVRQVLTYASGGMLPQHIAYIIIPSFEDLYAESMTFFADSLQHLIMSLDQQNPVGWVIDLRKNNGGAAMPMIAGIGPLLNKENAYYTVDAAGDAVDISYYRDGGYYSFDIGKEEDDPIAWSTVKYQVRDPKKPVAVLTSFKTASSAEAVAAIFAGQENVQLIGEKTNGLTSVNSFNFLSDNSVLNLTVGYMANRNKKVYPQGIEPDIRVEPDISSQVDPELGAAIKWIKE